jgi:hypothetical protein
LKPISSIEKWEGIDLKDNGFKKKDCQYSRKIFIVTNENVIYRRGEMHNLQKPFKNYNESANPDGNPLK